MGRFYRRVIMERAKNIIVSLALSFYQFILLINATNAVAETGTGLKLTVV